ncbi:TonB-dependent receptor [soil metagenome]
MIPPRHRHIFALILLAAAALAGTARPLPAQEEPLVAPQTAPADGYIRLDPVTVIGSADEVVRLPGSGAYLTTEDLREQTRTNINRVLAEVPGVYVREEDGFGLFPNISLRGVDGGRSSKVTVMEDGILTAPAPYSAPAAYYFPNVARMSAVEVLKGSSQVKFGPHTTGGVINFRSTPVPLDHHFYLKSTYGTDNEVFAHGYFGDVIDSELGRLGYVIEGFYRRSDGFREIDERPGFHGGDDTGFTQIEPMLKIFFEPATDVYQRVEGKFGYSNLDADETYLGLSERDARRDPTRRYAASRFDNIQTEQYRSYLRHIIEPTDQLRLTTTGYYNNFARNWFKLRRIREEDGNAVGPPEAIAAGGNPLAVLKGDAAGTLDVRNNNRSYYAYGIQENIDLQFATGQVEHALELGFRYHYDQIDRFQQDESFVQDRSGRIVSHSKGPLGGGGNRLEETDAIAVYLKDTMDFGRLSLSPGIRYEHLEFSYNDRDTSGADPDRVVASGSSDLDVFAPGIGANYEITDLWSAFGGVYRGFSTPGPRGAVREGLQEETSLGYELGIRHTGDYLKAELVGFYTAFDDLIVPDNVGGSGSLGTVNVGDIVTYGVEFKLSADPAAAAGMTFRIPLSLAFTATEATLDGAASSADAESIFSGGRDGNRVPYVPEYQIFASAGLEVNRFGISVDASFTPEVYASANNVSRPVDAQGNPDARFGEIDSAFLVDVTAHYDIKDNIRLLGGVKNVFGEEYISTRLPEGPRTGRPRFFYIGAEITL